MRQSQVDKKGLSTIIHLAREPKMVVERMIKLILYHLVIVTSHAMLELDFHNPIKMMAPSIRL